MTKVKKKKTFGCHNPGKSVTEKSTHLVNGATPLKKVEGTLAGYVLRVLMLLFVCN